MTITSANSAQSMSPVSYQATSPPTGLSPKAAAIQEIKDCLLNMKVIKAGDERSVIDLLKNDAFMADIHTLPFDDQGLGRLYNKLMKQGLSTDETYEMGNRLQIASTKDNAILMFPMLIMILQLHLWVEELVENEQREEAGLLIRKKFKEENSKNASPHLDISGYGLSSLPELLASLQATELNISHNNLSALDVLSKKIEILNANGNQFYKIPTAITELDHIESLDLSNNNLHTLFLNPYYPTGIKQNTLPNSLRSLNISGNPELEGLDYQALPAELIKLDVSGCSINEIELTLMPEKVTIICNGNTTLLVKGEKFTGEKWNGITIQREVSAKPTYQQYP